MMMFMNVALIILMRLVSHVHNKVVKETEQKCKWLQEIMEEKRKKKRIQ